MIVNNKINILLWLLIVILLLPILFFPLSPDASIYLDSGRIIANGGKLYVDNIDLKQPLIYYIFALVYMIFGYSEISIRLFDFLWQFATVISLFFLVFKAINIKTAFITSIIYSLTYTTLGYSQSAQCETFVALPLVWLIYFLTFRRKEKAFIFLSGIMLGLIAGLKITFILIFLATIVYFFTTVKIRKDQIIYTLLVFAGTIFGSAISMLPLLDSDICHGYTLVFNYQVYYSGIHFISSEIIKIMLKNTGIILGDRYSLLLTISMVIGIYFWLGKFKPINKKKSWRMFNLSLMLIFFLFLSVVIERKFWDYHFARMFLPMLIFSAVGLNFLYNKFSSFLKKGATYTKIIVVIITMILIFLSPVPRWFNILLTTYYYFTNTEKYDAQFSEYISNGLVPLRVHCKIIAEKINNNMNPNDLVITISTGSNAINYFLKTDKITAFRNSQFIFNPLKYPEWDYRFSKELHQADWVVIQTDDSREEVIGDDISSWEMLKRDTDNFDYLIRNFSLFDSVGNFLIFKRNFP